MKLGNGNYARMRFQLVAGGNHFAVVESYYNPSVPGIWNTIRPTPSNPILSRQVAAWPQGQPAPAIGKMESDLYSLMPKLL